MDVIGSVFEHRNAPGDFAWMITRPDYADALFIFNDNESEFRAHQGHAPGSARCHRGGGNAVIRPYQCEDPPRAAGIPTGDSGGYPRLTEHVRSVIDEAFQAIQALIDTGRYQRIIYSAAPDGGLGTGIFVVGDDVKRYIVAGLQQFAA